MRPTSFLLLIMILISLAPLADAPQSESATFTIQKGYYPWHEWLGHYKGAYSFEDFLDEVRRLNGLPQDATFMEFNAGDILKAPALTLTATTARTEIKAVVPPNTYDASAFDDLKTKLDNAVAEIERLRGVIATLTGRGGKDSTKTILSVTIFGMLLAFIIVVVKHLKLIKEWNALAAQTTPLKNQNAKFRHFLNMYTHEVEVPEDIGAVRDGSKVIHLLKAVPVNGDYGVYFPGNKSPISLKNAKKYLDRAPNPALEDLYIQPERVRGHKQDLWARVSV